MTDARRTFYWGKTFYTGNARKVIIIIVDSKQPPRCHALCGSPCVYMMLPQQRKYENKQLPKSKKNNYKIYFTNLHVFVGTHDLMSI